VTKQLVGLSAKKRITAHQLWSVLLGSPQVLPLHRRQLPLGDLAGRWRGSSMAAGLWSPRPLVVTNISRSILHAFGCAD
jgi:hypothetical protein